MGRPTVGFRVDLLSVLGGRPAGLRSRNTATVSGTPNRRQHDIIGSCLGLYVDIEV